MTKGEGAEQNDCQGPKPEYTEQDKVASDNSPKDKVNIHEFTTDVSKWLNTEINEN